MPYSRLISTFIRLLIYMLIILYASFEESPKMLLSLAIVASLSIIFKTYRCLPVLLMFLFFFTYVVNLIPFFFAGEYIFYYPPKGGFYETLFIHTIFLCTLDTFLLPIKKRLYINEKMPQKRNVKIFLLLCGLFVFFLIFSIQGDTILETGGYGKEGNTESLGGFGLYFVILVPLLYVYSGKEKIFQIIVILLSLLMIVKILLYGGRMPVLMLGLLLFALYYDNRKRKISIIKIAVMMLPALYIFILLGAVRANPLKALTASWGELLVLPFKGDFMETYIEFFGNQNDIFYSSAILNQATLSGVLDTYSRAEIFLYNIASIFVPYSFLPEKASIIVYIQKNIAITGGGALLSTYSYFYLSYVGVVFVSYFLAFIINKLQKSSNLLFILYAVMVLTTFPSWFGYNVISLFKISFYIVPLYLMTRLLLKKYEKHTIRRGASS